MSWQPYFTTTPLWTKSLYYASHDDMLFGSISGLGWRELQELLGAECAWHINRPGAKAFSEAAWKELGTRLEPPPERQAFALRASRFWFGEKMGPLIAPFFAENISHEFIVDPGKIMEQTDIADPLATMVHQAIATRQIAKSLDKARKLQEVESILKGEELGFFLNILLMNHGAAITSKHRVGMMKIEAAINRGDSLECQRLIAATGASLKAASPQWTSLYDSVPKKQLMTHYTRRRSPHGYLSYLDFAEFQKEIEGFASTYEQKIIERSIPSWFQNDIDRRRVCVYRASDKIQVDGRMTESAWSKSQPVANFVRQNRLQLESKETVARVVFDESNLYVAFQCDEFSAKERVIFSIAGHKKAENRKQWIVGRDGKMVASKSAATVRTSTSDGVWIAEMAIPLTELGFKVTDGRSCVTQFVRHSKAETVSYGYAHGDSIKTLSHFVLTEFFSDSNVRTPLQVGLNMGEPGFRHETTGTGAGTVISGELSVLSERPLHHVTISAQAGDGVRSLGQQAWPTLDRVPLIWRPERSFMMRFPEEVPGVVVRFTVKSDEGKWTFTRRFGSPKRREKPPADLYTEGVGTSQALNHPIHFASPGPAETPWPEGTIELWVKPNWKSVPRRDGPRGGLDHALVHMGPIRPDHPTLFNVNSLALTHSASGYLNGTLSSSRYRHRIGNASVRDWNPGTWHHVAMQWILSDPDHGGVTTVQIFIDGKLASQETHATPKETATEPLVPSEFSPPIQIGSMNTGIRPADAAIDELRISSVRRYAKNFEPSKRLSSDKETIALFRFDGDLESEGSGKLSAAVGAAQ